MLYADAIDTDKALADKILKLSDGLHYTLHEGNKPYVAIDKEINFLENYIDLQKARLGDKVKVQYNTSVDNLNYIIPTLLLTPFVENAFKYTSLMPGNHLLINIKILAENNQLIFIVSNYFVPEKFVKRLTFVKKSGIGVGLTRKRLDLLFENNYDLDIRQNDDLFSVNLKFSLNEMYSNRR